MRAFRVVGALVLAACGSDVACILPPCALPVAINLTVESNTGSALVATVTVTGATSTTLVCSGTCTIPGQGGSYQLTVRAPGFQEVHSDVTVTATPRECSCPLVDTKSVKVTLSPM